MASALCRVAARSATRFVRKSLPVVTSVRHSGGGDVAVTDTQEGKVATPGRQVANELGHSVGKQRYELLGIQRGVDVWDDQPYPRPKDRGTFANPIILKHRADNRTVACVCEDEMDDILYTVCTKGQPNQCKCGHWWLLVDEDH